MILASYELCKLEDQPAGNDVKSGEISIRGKLIPDPLNILKNLWLNFPLKERTSIHTWADYKITF